LVAANNPNPTPLVGNIRIESSVITNNTGGSWYPTYPQISNHADTPIQVFNSTIQ
jgi:hypothetical protein